MSEETPRLSRRQLREQGLLDAPADGPSVLDTTELRLRRPSRKELRELAQQEARERPATAGEDDYVGEPTQAMEAITHAAESAPESEPVQHERKSVFDRFEDPHAAESQAEEAEPEGDAAEDAQVGATATDEEGSLRERFLAMTKRDETDVAVESQSVAEAGEPVAKQTELGESEPAAQDAGAAEDTMVEAPRRTWLNIIILILIAALVGYLGGSWINVTFLSEPLPGVLADQVHLLL